MKRNSEASALPAPTKNIMTEGADKLAPLSVFMFIQAYHPFIGGAERQLQALTAVFPSLNVNTTVITRRFPGAEYTPYAVVSGAPVYRIKLYGGHALKSLSYTVGALRLMVRLRREAAIDVLHAHELLSPTTTALFGKLLLRRPVVAKVLGGGAHGEVPRLLAKPLGRLRMTLFARLVDRFFCVSDEIAEQLLEVGVPAAKLVRIPNGVDMDVYAPPTPVEKADIRARLGLPAGPLIVYTGRLAPEKGIRTLMEAWARLHLTYPEAHLLLLGEGPERAMLEERHLPRLSLLGAQSDIPSYLRAADVFVLASEREGLSNALLEAMATGLTCVATNVGGTPEALRDGVSGLLTPPSDPTALADALAHALSDEELRSRLGAAAREHIRSAYSLASVARQLRAVYDEVRSPR